MRTAEGYEHRLSTQEHRKEAIMDGITNKEMAQSRIQRMRWWTLAVVSVTVLLATIDETILNVAIPSLQRDLGASASSLQWMVNAYMLVFGGLLLTMGGVLVVGFLANLAIRPVDEKYHEPESEKKEVDA